MASFFGIALPVRDNLMLYQTSSRQRVPGTAVPATLPQGETPCGPYSGAFPVPGRDWLPGPLQPGTGPRREGLM